MKKLNREIIKVVELISTGNFSENDVVVMYVHMRELPGIDKLTREFGDYFAHIDSRDKGLSLNIAIKYIKNFVDVSYKGGRISSVPLTTKSEICQNLSKFVSKLPIGIVAKKNFSNQSLKIVTLLLEKLDGVSFDFSKSNQKAKDESEKILVDECYLKYQNGKLAFCFRKELPGPAIKMEKNATICSELIS